MALKNWPGSLLTFNSKPSNCLCVVWSMFMFKRTKRENQIVLQSEHWSPDMPLWFAMLKSCFVMTSFDYHYGHLRLASWSGDLEQFCFFLTRLYFGNNNCGLLHLQRTGLLVDRIGIAILRHSNLFLVYVCLVYFCFWLSTLGKITNGKWFGT